MSKNTKSEPTWAELEAQALRAHATQVYATPTSSPAHVAGAIRRLTSANRIEGLTPAEMSTIVGVLRAAKERREQNTRPALPVAGDGD